MCADARYQRKAGGGDVEVIFIKHACMMKGGTFPLTGTREPSTLAPLLASRATSGTEAGIFLIRSAYVTEPDGRSTRSAGSEPPRCAPRAGPAWESIPDHHPPRRS